MRIDDVSRLPQTETPGSSQQVAAKDKNRAVGPGTDRSELSSLARELETPDEKRLESLRLAVESGQYRVSSTALANSIIENHLKS
jgi:flagellar biosynthesis anti-sigma factor FlgM